MSHHGSKLPIPLNGGRLLVVANLVRDHLQSTLVSQPVTKESGGTPVTNNSVGDSGFAGDRGDSGETGVKQMGALFWIHS